MGHAVVEEEVEVPVVDWTVELAALEMGAEEVLLLDALEVVLETAAEVDLEVVDEEVVVLGGIVMVVVEVLVLQDVVLEEVEGRRGSRVSTSNSLGTSHRRISR